MKFRKKLIFLKEPCRYYGVMCNFELLSVVKKFWKKCGETLKNRG